MKILHWENKETGANGHGQPLPDASADAWVEEANKTFPNLRHWAEPVQEV